MRMVFALKSPHSIVLKIFDTRHAIVVLPFINRKIIQRNSQFFTLIKNSNTGEFINGLMVGYYLPLPTLRNIDSKYSKTQNPSVTKFYFLKIDFSIILTYITTWIA